MKPTQNKILATAMTYYIFLNNISSSLVFSILNNIIQAFYFHLLSKFFFAVI